MSDVEQINKQRTHIIQIANKYGMNLSEDAPMTMKQMLKIVRELDSRVQMERNWQKDMIEMVQELLSKTQSDLNMLGKSI